VLLKLQKALLRLLKLVPKTPRKPQKPLVMQLRVPQVQPLVLPLPPLKV
jgi:hypothetical protein